MAGNTNYPGALDTTTNLPIASALVSVELDGDGNANKVHSNLHGVLSEAAVAIEGKIGTGASTPVANRVLRGSGTGTSAWSQVALATDVSGTLPLANGGTASTSAGDARTALGLGTAAVAATGISNTNVPVFTTGVADDDFLRVAGTNIEGRSAAEVLGDIGASPVAGSGSIVTVGALNSGSITSGFTSIDVGAGAITTTGALSIASMGTDWTNAGRTVADMGIVTTIDINGGTINGITDLAVADGGTGASSLTDHGVVLGSGTAAVSVTGAGTSGQVFTSGGSGADPDWADASSGGGITRAENWRTTTNQTVSGVTALTNWELNDTAGAGVINQGITHSSGIFTFPETGIWSMNVMLYSDKSGTSSSSDSQIQMTTNNSTYVTMAHAAEYPIGWGSMTLLLMFDVTNTSNDKIKIMGGGSSVVFVGNTDINRCAVTFIRLGDT